MNFSYWLRLLDVLLAGLVFGLCLLRVNWDHANRARNARIAGLGLICLAIGWGSFYRRYDEFRPWVPFLTAGLVFCLYGMRRPAAGEPHFKGNEK